MFSPTTSQQILNSSNNLFFMPLLKNIEIVFNSSTPKRNSCDSRTLNFFCGKQLNKSSSHYIFKVIKTDEQELNSLDYQVLLSYKQTKTDFFPVKTAMALTADNDSKKESK